MIISDFIKKFTIEPETDIKPHFHLEKEISIDVHGHKGCFNCGDTANQKRLESTSWSGVLYCWKCNCLNVIYYTDRMSGSYLDTVYCYVDKPPTNEDR